MSWEVSSMPSKRSFFNLTLFQKHLSRFWPLWGIVSLVGALFPLYLQLALMQNGTHVTDAAFFREGLYQIAAYIVPAFTCCYAILCVMAVWGYLYNARPVGLMHTLPVDRTCLFLTNTLAGLAMALIPFAVTGGLLCLIALCWGFFDLAAVVNTVWVVLFCTLLFFGLGTLCAMLTGHALVLPVFYLLANFLAFLMEALTTSLAKEFLIGLSSAEEIRRMSFFSPVVMIYTIFGAHYELSPDGTEQVARLQNMWIVALYALVGLAMLALAWHLYRRRQSESAGDVVAFRWLRPVFRYGVALLSGLTIGRLLYELMWATLFQKGEYASPLPMAVCLFLGGLLGYYAASMLLAKSRRVFGRKSLVGVGIVAAGAAAVCLLVSVDLFGVERRVPAWDEIESVSIGDRGIYSGWSAEDCPEQARALREFHQAIVDDRDYIRSYVPNWEEEESRVFSHYVHLVYRLKDGSVLTREYDLWMSRDRAEIPGTYENLLAEFYRDPEVRAYDVRIPENAELNSIDVCCDYAESYYVNANDHADGDNRETRQIYAALQKDAEEGNIPAKDIFAYHSSWFSNNFYLQLNYHTYNRESGAYYGSSKDVYLSPSMTNTVNTLVELGYVTEESMALWKQNMENAQTEAEQEAAAWAEENLVPAAEHAVPAE